MSDTDLVMARTNFIDFPKPETPVPVRARAVARAGHPVVQRNPSMWEPIRVDYELEQPLSEKDQLDQLRPEAVELGINVDGRWSAKRLRAEIDRVKAANAAVEA